MERLTPSLSKTLKELGKFDGDKEFAKRLNKDESPIPGFSTGRLSVDMADLADLGYIELFWVDCQLDCFLLTAKGRDYQHNCALDTVKQILERLFQLLLGVSGGLVVYLLGKLLG